LRVQAAVVNRAQVFRTRHVFRLWFRHRDRSWLADNDLDFQGAAGGDFECVVDQGTYWSTQFL
jgi:hypothetical protein